jgi:hypothetical protein
MIARRSKKRLSALLIGGLCFTFSCGMPQPSQRREFDSITINANSFTLNDGLDSDDGLANISTVKSMNIEVKDCSSGYKAVLSNIADLKLYRSDRNCRILLHGFSIMGEQFTGGPLEGQIGEYKMFYSPLRTMKVVISEMISNPIQDHDEIGYSIYEPIEEGDQIDVMNLIRGPNRRVERITGSKNIPNFKLDFAKFIATIPCQKSFGLSFNLQCNVPMKWSGTPASLTCDRTRIKDISYILVKDVYSGNPSLKLLDRLFKSASIRVDEKKDYFRPNYTHNGGFKTARTNTILKSPNDTAKNSQMLLILRTYGGYQYFNIDFNTGQ